MELEGLEVMDSVLLDLFYRYSTHINNCLLTYDTVDCCAYHHVAFDIAIVYDYISCDQRVKFSSHLAAGKIVVV